MIQPKVILVLLPGIVIADSSAWPPQQVDKLIELLIHIHAFIAISLGLIGISRSS